MSRRDRIVLRVLQGLVLTLPLARGGNSAGAIAVSAPLVLGLLAYTLYARRTRTAPATPGLLPLVAFVALALCMTIPLPPSLLAWLDPRAAELTRTLLPGWPLTGGWSPERALAFDPYAVWIEVVRLGVPLGVFAVLIGYPWGSDDDRRDVVTQLVLTLLAGGAALASCGLGQLALGGATDGGARARGPFINPNHFAAWIEMIVPVAVGYLATLLGRAHRNLTRQLETGRGMGMQRQRLWIDTLVAQQARLWAPLAVTALIGVMLAAHLASGSRGGAAAVVIGVIVTLAGVHRQARSTGARRWLVPSALALGCAITVGALGHAALQDETAVEAVDVSLGARVAVARQGAAIVAAHPVFGTGLGSWLAAYRPYQAPPVEYGIWDHAHNDYLELASETGGLGLLLVGLFMLGVLRAVRVPAPAARTSFDDHGFGAPDWWKDIAAGPGLRWGLAGGLAAVLVHSAFDFGLRMPANLLVAAVLTALLLLSSARPAARGGHSLGALAALLLIAALPLLGNRVLLATDGIPLATSDALSAADLARAEGDAAGDARALALVRSALDQAPTNRDAHDFLASMLPSGSERQAALRAVIALQPWAPEARDALALDCYARGDTHSAAVELEESVARFPYLATHDVLLRAPRTEDTRAQLRLLADGDSPALRMAALDQPLLDAVVRGLRRSLDEAVPGEFRTAAAEDLVQLLEARGDHAAAAAVLWAEAEPTASGATKLARAAQNYLRADDRASAESALLTALRQNPDQGDLYRTLAVEVYAAQGDFVTADQVLAAGQDRAIDMLPVYLGATDLIARRERARVEQGGARSPEPLANMQAVVAPTVVR